jgi:S-adenosylmethionine:diacylglycerol 3-amino-3-carboxypropyl transferase
MDIIERLRFDAARCEAQFSKGVAMNIEEALAEIERLRAAMTELLSGHDSLYVAHFGHLSDPRDDIAAKAARELVQQLENTEAEIPGPHSAGR